MSRASRQLLPWEARCGGPTCKVKPGSRCVTTRPLHMPSWNARDLAYVGTPTSAHRARYRLWCYLWCRSTCEVGGA